MSTLSQTHRLRVASDPVWEEVDRLRKLKASLAAALEHAGVLLLSDFADKDEVTPESIQKARETIRDALKKAKGAA